MSVKYKASSRQFEVDSPKHLRMDKDTKPTMCQVKFMKCKVTRVYFYLHVLRQVDWFNP